MQLFFINIITRVVFIMFNNRESNYSSNKLFWKEKGFSFNSRIKFV